MTDNNDIESLSFEAALHKLEDVVKSLEDDALPLDEAVTAFELGNKLRTHCEKKLKEAKIKIEEVENQQNITE